ncbi:MAG: hypothetical protein ACPLVF_09235 [Thermovenabulum sp.]
MPDVSFVIDRINSGASEIDYEKYIKIEMYKSRRKKVMANATFVWWRFLVLLYNFINSLLIRVIIFIKIKVVFKR